MRNGEYGGFLEKKSQLGGNHGFAPNWEPSFLFDFQQDLVTWAIRRGRAAIFADCGLGKTPMQLVWAENVRRHTGGDVLILTPLAVAHQTLRESEKFGIDCDRAGPGRQGITVTNYEQLHKLNANDYAGVVCDESSILKNFSGKRRAEITSFMRKMRYRLLCTATAAPNDYHELGTSSEALGELGYTDMLGKFFKNDQGNIATGRQWGGVAKWRLKGHAEEPFWRWVCSWARAVRRPSDLGYSDERFALPPLHVNENIVHDVAPMEGHLFHVPARGLDEQRKEQRETIEERCAKVAELVDHSDPAVAWCHYNAEGDLLERLIPDAVQVSGSDTDEAKEEKFLGFAEGRYRVMVTKPKIGAFGLNWQHCAHHTYFPSHSFEQWYQAVRRSWRFGQDRPVTVDIVTTPSGEGVLQNLKQKADAADLMFDRLVGHMRDQLSIDRGSYSPGNKLEMPTWI
tara:strand:- start:935 stop:2302 length:1368 start_codon:yes stop_codon:yes gene_type:complete